MARHPCVRTLTGMNEREIFIAALHQPGHAERQAFLDGACGGDAGLRLRVEELLAEQERLGSFLEQPIATSLNSDELESAPERDVTAPLAAREGPGTGIGPYKLLQVIGEGGMGTVWMADQSQPIRRRVAVKVVKAGRKKRGQDQCRSAQE